MRLPLKSLLLSAALAYSGSGFAGEVSRALFTIGVDNREPAIIVDSIDSSSHRSISFFTELTICRVKPRRINGPIKTRSCSRRASKSRSERWRVWTSKTLIPDWKGTWTVNVLDDERAVVSSKSFEYR